MSEPTPGTPMPSNATLQEWLRFVKLRAPQSQKRGTTTVSSGGAFPKSLKIAYDPSLMQDETFINQVKAASSDSASTLQPFLDAATAFKDSAFYIPDASSISSSLDPEYFSNLRDKLSSWTGSSPLRGSDLMADTAALRDSSTKSNLYTKLWSNMVLQGISPQIDAYSTGKLTTAMRILNFAQLLPAMAETEITTDVITTAERAAISYPSSFMPKAFAGSTTTTPAPESKDLTNFKKRNVLQVLIEQAQDAKSSVESWADNVTAKVSKIPTPQRGELRTDPTCDEVTAANTAYNTALTAYNTQVSNMYKVSSANMNAITAYSLNGSHVSSLLNNIIADGDLDRLDVLEKLNSRVNLLSKKLTKLPIKKTKKVTVIGNTILEEQLPDYSQYALTDIPTLDSSLNVVDDSGSGGSGERMAERSLSSSGGNEDECPVQIRTIGVGDLLRVEQKLLCYKPGDIAHIENILKGELRVRKTRRLNRSEQTFTEEIQRITEEEHDLQTTNRYEMDKEAQNTANSTMAITAGLNVSSDLGVVKIAANLGFSSSSSTSSSQTESSKIAKEAVEKTRKKVSESIKTTRTTTMIEEFEEDNEHTIDNTLTGVGATPTHNVGIYRWIDKYYQARLMNYGKRLFVEFSIPEPAAYHIYCSSQATDPNLVLSKPISPKDYDSDPNTIGYQNMTVATDITDSSYMFWAGLYNVTVPPPPKELIMVQKSIGQKGPGDGSSQDGTTVTIEIPQDYEAYLWNFEIWDDQAGGNDNWVGSPLGNIFPMSTYGHAATIIEAPRFAHCNAIGELSVPIWGKTLSTAGTLVAYCRRTDASYAAWQQDVFGKIMDAYNGQMVAYENALSQVKANLSLIGTNPAMNSDIQLRELKRGCIEQMINIRKAKNQVCTRSWGDYGAVNDDTVTPCGFIGVGDMYPYIQYCQAIEQGSDIAFYEGCMDWKNLTYQYFPYYWGRQCKWKTLYNLTDDDPLFNTFLQAGAAKVYVPVEPGYEPAVCQYLETGIIYNSTDTVGSDSDPFFDALTEMHDALNLPDSPVQVGDCWEVKIPTSLVILQADTQGLTVTGLPGYDSTEDDYRMPTNVDFCVKP